MQLAAAAAGAREEAPRTPARTATPIKSSPRLDLLHTSPTPPPARSTCATASAAEGARRGSRRLACYIRTQIEHA